ncbi:sugar isomerase domain-containing protein [Geodermatophilus maliterrae]|uniref:Sugar isomerase domain-containing protein n=1 Tax=Geodermatophilus maliterrae TaxID=3162531 RepID=A0ABV3XB73_9ACTN
MTEPGGAGPAEEALPAGGGTRTAAAVYQDRLQAVLATALREEVHTVRRAAEVVAATFSARGVLYVFGSGHSHMFAEEAFYRAGGAARVCPVLKPPYMLHEGAVRSTVLEREPGHAADLLSGYRLEPERDCMLVASNSGANALPVEVASAAKAHGLPVVAITSRAYAQAVRHPGPRLHEVADVVIDNHCPPGDALVRLADDLPPTGPASTVVGLALLNSLVVEACAVQLARGERPEVFLSANMPGAAEHNEEAVAALSGRVPHL